MLKCRFPGPLARDLHLVAGAGAGALRESGILRITTADDPGARDSQIPLCEWPRGLYHVNGMAGLSLGGDRAWRTLCGGCALSVGTLQQPPGPQPA